MFAEQKCNFPGSPAHSTVTFSDDSLTNGAIASYSCERGFELLGPARRVCDNGSWTPEGIPFCAVDNGIDLQLLFTNQFSIGF
ncbi:CLUMA_CG017138, isoform A [Clunio marinus]|uniref:CLUMA_CG017138, isoform A n=1 Tax=Clunio marinus TaxID=568069 RepID=A0A1J1IWT4_9DIPT|nr:CLUMA_CG017138, isoform A [Clunio marinus]